MSGERGDIIVAGLVKTVAALLMLGLVFFEIGAIIVNEFQLDGIGQDTARTAALVLRDQKSPISAQHAAERVVATHEDATLDGFSSDTRSVTVTVSRPARVLLIDRVGFLHSIVNRSVTKSVTAPR
jgi:hypothetical protein